MIWYSHLFKNFPQIVVIHRVNRAEVDVFLELSCFFDDLTVVHILISGFSAFSKSSLNICPLQYSGLENSMEPIVHGVTKSRT